MQLHCIYKIKDEYVDNRGFVRCDEIDFLDVNKYYYLEMFSRLLDNAAHINMVNILKPVDVNTFEFGIISYALTDEQMEILFDETPYMTMQDINENLDSKYSK